jgi:sugar lactone lactonase YvrE
MTTKSKLKVLVCTRSRSLLAECPIWDGRRLLYLDLTDPAIVELWPGAPEVRHNLSLPAPLGGLCLLRDRGLAVCCREGIFRLDPESLRVEGLMSAPHRSFEIAPPNDAAVHPSGRLVVTTADAAERAATGGVFLLSQGEGLRRLLGGYTVGNGPAFSPDGSTAYIADSPKGVIHSYEWNAGHSALEKPRTFAIGDETPGLPDGLAVDADGGIWNARWGGAMVIRYEPDGRESCRIEVPAKFVTSCVFGGRELRTLYITTARAEQEGSDFGGHVFAVEVGRAGLPPSLAAT